MLGISLAMLIGSALLMLRLSPGGSFPSPLSQEEEKKYLTQWQNGDISARNVLVEHNLRLVAHIIKKYYTQTNDIEDLISIGTIGHDNPIVYRICGVTSVRLRSPLKRTNTKQKPYATYNFINPWPVISG